MAGFQVTLYGRFWVFPEDLWNSQIPRAMRLAQFVANLWTEFLALNR
jgi:hypothetical protein